MVAGRGRPLGLTGDRHQSIRLADGRLVIVFRNAAPNAKDKGFIAWVGIYDDIKQGKLGQYRVSMTKTFKYGLYPGLPCCPTAQSSSPPTPASLPRKSRPSSACDSR